MSELQTASLIFLKIFIIEFGDKNRNSTVTSKIFPLRPSHGSSACGYKVNLQNFVNFPGMLAG